MTHLTSQYLSCELVSSVPSFGCSLPTRSTTSPPRLLKSFDHRVTGHWVADGHPNAPPLKSSSIILPHHLSRECQATFVPVKRTAAPSLNPLSTERRSLIPSRSPTKTPHSPPPPTEREMLAGIVASDTGYMCVFVSLCVCVRLVFVCGRGTEFEEFVECKAEDDGDDAVWHCLLSGPSQAMYSDKSLTARGY